MNELIQTGWFPVLLLVGSNVFMTYAWYGHLKFKDKPLALVITRRISESVGMPVVASGGAGSLEHMAEVLLAGKADAVLAASIFHFGTYTVGDVKQFLAGKGIPVRQ